MKKFLGVRAPRRGPGLTGGVTAVAVALVGVLALAMPPAVAQTTSGAAQANQRCDSVSNGGSFSVVQESSVGVSYAVPAGGGTLTSWSVAAGPNTDTFQLEVWRPAGANTFTLVFISIPLMIAATTGVHTFPLSPAVAVN